MYGFFCTIPKTVLIAVGPNLIPDITNEPSYVHNSSKLGLLRILFFSFLYAQATDSSRSGVYMYSYNFCINLHEADC